MLAFAGLAADAPPPLRTASAAPPWPEGLRLSSLLALAGAGAEALAAYPWYRDVDFPLPCATFKAVCRRQRAALARALNAARIEPLLLVPYAVHPREFNEGVRAAGNKHLFEWRIVARFLRLLWERYGEEGVEVVCDRLSGRDFYGPSLAKLFAGADVRAIEETARSSTYRVEERGGSGRALRVSFLVEGDGSSFATALASCASKYVRELFMRPLNEWFAARVPGLRPTAGYFADARRFLDEVRPACRELSLSPDLLIRIC